MEFMIHQMYELPSFDRAVCVLNCGMITWIFHALKYYNCTKIAHPLVTVHAMQMGMYFHQHLVIA